MTKAGKTFSFAESTQQPTQHPDLLVKCWQPNTLEGYLPYKVKVTQPAAQHGGRQLTFVLAHEEATTKTPREFSVQMPGQVSYVWSERPSTAQLVVPGGPAYGFLYLTDTWARQFKVDPAIYAETGGGKFPISAGTKRLQNLYEALNDKTAQDMLLDALDTVLGPPSEKHRPTREGLSERMNSELTRMKLLDALDALAKAMPVEDRSNA
jgi:hypothetical protein